MDTVAVVLDALERAPDVVRPLVFEIPPALRRRRPRDGKWSAHEHACHLAQVHGLFRDRLAQILREPRPVVRPYDPGVDDPPSFLLNEDLEEAMARYATERAELVASLRRLEPADWLRTAEHPEYSHYSVFIMFRHLALHDFFHAYRIEELLLNRAWASQWEAWAERPGARINAEMRQLQADGCFEGEARLIHPPDDGAGRDDGAAT